MISTATLLILVASPVMQAEVKYNVTAKGQKLGTLSSWTTLTSSSFVEKTKIKVNQGGRVADIATNAESTPQGDWRKKQFDASSGGQSVSIVATPTKAGAHVVMNTGGTKRERDVPKKTATTTRDTTITWFRTHTPKVGEKVTYQRFDAQSLAWSDVTVRYVGPKSVTIGGKPRAGFELERIEGNRKGTIVVDSKSVLIMMETPDVRFERIYP